MSVAATYQGKSHNQRIAGKIQSNKKMATAGLEKEQTARSGTPLSRTKLCLSCICYPKLFFQDYNNALWLIGITEQIFFLKLNRNICFKLKSQKVRMWLIIGYRIKQEKIQYQGVEI